MGKEDKSSFYRKWNKEIDKLADNKSRYEWDEIEELITDEFENDNMNLMSLWQSLWNLICRVSK